MTDVIIMQDLKPQLPIAGADERSRGRRRSRVRDEGEDGGGGGGGGGGGDDEKLSPDGDGGAAEGPSRKRRRSRKGLDKKFACPQDGCGKSYSRAEHLYRHQLNRE